MQNAPREHSAILPTFIKLPFVFKTFALSIFEWLLLYRILKTYASVIIMKYITKKLIDFCSVLPDLIYGH